MTKDLFSVISNMIPWMEKETIKESLGKAEKIYREPNGFLCLWEYKKNIFEILMFASKDRETKRKLLQAAVSDHPNFQIIFFERGKYDNKKPTTGTICS